MKFQHRVNLEYPNACLKNQMHSNMTQMTLYSRVHSRQTRASSRLCDEPAAVLDGYTGGVIGVGEHQRSYSQPSVAVKRVASNFANNKKHFIKECRGIQLWGEDTSSGPHLKRSSRRWLLQHSSRPI